MKILTVTLISLTLTGCSTIKELVPSFWDDNQSSRIIDIRQLANNIDCKEPQLPQAKKIQSNIEWFQLYSESKGWRQQDVLKIIAPMRDTVNDWTKRSEENEGSRIYCEMKKRVLQEQSSRAASAVLGRF